MSFVLSKILWALVQPSNFLLLLLITASALLIAGRRSLGTWLAASATAAFGIIGLLPVGTWLLLPLENRFPPDPKIHNPPDGIITLGGVTDPEISAARGQTAIKEAAERLTALISLGRTYPKARLVFSGGSGALFGSDMTEAAAFRRALERLAPELERVILEDRSRNTYENAILSKELVSPAADQCWLLITSAHHMPRAIGVFRWVGWSVMPYPVDYRTTGTLNLWERPDIADRLQQFDLAVHTWLGLLAYRLMNRTSELLPRPSPGACS